MGKFGKPGSSLRAFRGFCPNAIIYGAEIDQSILFKEERIKTFFIGQTDLHTFQKILNQIKGLEFDLVIDDGLHSPDANINSLCFGLPIIKRKGWIVIEDIGADALDIWKIVIKLIPANYQSYLYNTDAVMIFCVQRLK